MDAVAAHLHRSRQWGGQWGGRRASIKEFASKLVLSRDLCIRALAVPPIQRTANQRGAIGSYFIPLFDTFFDRFSAQRKEEICSRLLLFETRKLGTPIMKQGEHVDEETGKAVDKPGTCFMYFGIEGDLEVRQDEAVEEAPVDSRVQFNRAMTLHADIPSCRQTTNLGTTSVKSLLYGETSVRDGTPRSISVYTSQKKCTFALLQKSDYAELCSVKAKRNEELTIERAKKLKELALFSALTDEQRAKLAYAMTEESYTRGSVVASQGQPLRLIVVQKGEVLVSSVPRRHPTRKYAFNALDRVQNDERNVGIALVGANELLLDADIFAGSPSCSETCKAVTATDTYELDFTIGRDEEFSFKAKFISTILPTLKDTGPYQLKNQMRAEMKRSRSRVRRSPLKLRNSLAADKPGRTGYTEDQKAGGKLHNCGASNARKRQQRLEAGRGCQAWDVQQPTPSKHQVMSRTKIVSIDAPVNVQRAQRRKKPQAWMPPPAMKKPAPMTSMAVLHSFLGEMKTKERTSRASDRAFVQKRRLSLQALGMQVV
jgi:hypothetical protein